VVAVTRCLRHDASSCRFPIAHLKTDPLRSGKKERSPPGCAGRGTRIGRAGARALWQHREQGKMDGDATASCDPVGSPDEAAGAGWIAFARVRGGAAFGAWLAVLAGALAPEAAVSAVPLGTAGWRT